MFALALILAVLLILLFSPVVLSFGYDDGRFDVRARYVLLSFDLMKERPPKKPKAEKPKKPAPEPKKPKEKEPAAKAAKKIWAMVKASGRALNIIRRHLIFYKISVTAVVGGPDAHAAGDSYATYCVIIPNLIILLDSVFATNEPQVLILPDFRRDKTYWDITVKVRIMPWFALSAALYMLLQFTKVTLFNDDNREKVKGGKRHGQTTSHK
jgi:hypothetical protein